MAIPKLPQGTINRLRGTVSVVDYPGLNVLASNLGKAGISLALGATGTPIPTMTGLTNAPEPYIPATLTINLLRTQTLSGNWRSQLENNAVIGDIEIRTDSSVFPDYSLSNCMITSAGDLNMDGSNADYVVTITGTYYINNGLY